MFISESEMLGKSPQVQQLAQQGMPNSSSVNLPQGLSIPSSEPNTSPPQEEGMSLHGLIGNAAGNVGRWVEQSPPGQLYKNITDPMGAQQEREAQAQGLLHLPGEIGNELTHPQNIPGDIAKFAYHNPLDTALMAGSALENIPEDVKSAGNFIRHPLATTGKNIQAAEEAAGVVPSDLIAKTLGTLKEPNPDITRGLDTAAGSTYKDLLQQELAGLANKGDEVTFKDLQDYKNASSKMSKWDANTTASNQDYYRRLNKAYGNMIKEGAPEVEHLYKTYGMLKSAQDLPASLARNAIRLLLLNRLRQLFQ